MESDSGPVTRERRKDHARLDEASDLPDSVQASAWTLLGAIFEGEVPYIEFEVLHPSKTSKICGMARDLPSAAALIQLLPLLTDQVHTVVAEWAAEASQKFPSGDIPGRDDHPTSNGSSVPSTNGHSAPAVSGIAAKAPVASRELHEARRTILSICGKLTELVSEPSERIIEVACQYWESRALAIAAERRIANILEHSMGKAMDIQEIAGKTGIEEGKLGEISPTHNASIEERMAGAGSRSEC